VNVVHLVTICAYLITESFKTQLILCWAVISFSAPELKGDATGHIFAVS